MNTKLFIMLMVASFLSASSNIQAQIDSLIVERYYISDANDATDITGGGSLASGSITYRVYIDLAEGSKLLAVYGDESHEIKILSTEMFFNNRSTRSRSIGKDIRASRLKENTLALDSWITIGQASDTHFGVLKTEDLNGSALTINDGGSARIPGGLLVNNDPAAGIPLTISDGLVTATLLPANWIVRLNGEELIYTSDTTIFGTLNQSKNFVSNDFKLSNNGVAGNTTDNRVLIAQLTTKGELSLKLNVEIEQKDGSGTKSIRYVSDNPVGDEKTSRFLTYPAPPPPKPLCGCDDPDYLEFKSNIECIERDSCKTVIVFGCTDPIACNYNPTANFNVPAMCCYPGRCNNRDIKVVCPDIQENELKFSIYPNPAKDIVTIDILKGTQKEIQCLIYDSGGTILFSENLGRIPDEYVHQVNVSRLSNGLFFLRISGETQTVTKTLIKN